MYIYIYMYMYTCIPLRHCSALVQVAPDNKDAPTCG